MKYFSRQRKKNLNKNPNNTVLNKRNTRLLLSMDINQMLVCSLLLMCGVAHHCHNLYLKKNSLLKKLCYN